MHKVKLSKGGGKFRTIYVPSHDEKVVLRDLNVVLTQKAEHVLGPEVHGFRPRHSPVTNALAHVGYAFTVGFDLRDFFDNIKLPQVAKWLTADEQELVLVDGAPRQGLPTSPTVANLAAQPLDLALGKLVAKLSPTIYTRYADDLTFSTNDDQVVSYLLQEVPQVVGRCGFKVAPEKTRVQTARGGHRIITGLGVSAADIHPTRTVKRRLRAARHQHNYCAARGLEEWCKHKLPSQEPKTNRRWFVDAKRLCTGWRLPQLTKLVRHVVDEEELAPGIFITSDPAYMLGCSNYTTGWKSCFRQPKGAQHLSSRYYLDLAGAFVGVVLGPKTQSFFGVQRRQLRARCWIFKSRDGRYLAAGFYGEYAAKARLQDILTARFSVTHFIPTGGPRFDVVGSLGSSRPKLYYGSPKLNDANEYVVTF